MSDLISPEMLELNKELHHRKQKYGSNGAEWLSRVCDYIAEERADTYLDYGCGKGQLADAVALHMSTVEVRRYDPVTVPEIPEPADFVTCNDVLEHIEPKGDYLDAVLSDIASKIKKRGLLVISQRLANKKLKDGRNAHLIVKPTKWWVERLVPYFREIVEVEPIRPKRVGVELAVLVRPLPLAEDGVRVGISTVTLIQR